MPSRKHYSEADIANRDFRLLISWPGCVSSLRAEQTGAIGMFPSNRAPERAEPGGYSAIAISPLQLHRIVDWRDRIWYRNDCVKFRRPDPRPAPTRDDSHVDQTNERIHSRHTGRRQSSLIKIGRAELLILACAPTRCPQGQRATGRLRGVSTPYRDRIVRSP